MIDLLFILVLMIMGYRYPKLRKIVKEILKIIKRIVLNS